MLVTPAGDDVLNADHQRSNWLEAQKAREVRLTCPKCPVANRPGATYIELMPNGLAFCSVCSHSWIPEEK